MVKVKICGITNLNDALICAREGVSAVGFVFYRKSCRYVTPGKARQIIDKLPKDILKIGVFVDAKEKEIKRIAKKCRLDALQFHGNESPEFCNRFRPFKVIKAFRVKDRLGFRQIKDYKVFAFLFDTFEIDKAGGTGKVFNWGLLIRIRKRIRQPIFLSGGLNVANVARVLKLLKPQWVDVSTSVQLSARKKSARKISAFMRAVKDVTKSK